MYRKLLLRAETDEEFLVTRQALPHPRSANWEFLWEYSFPPLLYTNKFQRGNEWAAFCKRQREEEKESLQAPPSLPGPPPSIHNILGAALHKSDLKKKRKRGSPPVAGVKQKRD
jgi:hypothetical protein